MARFSQLGNDLYSGKRSFNIVGNAKRWLTIAGVLVALAIVVLIVRPLNGGIEFVGGSEFRINGTSLTSSEPAQDALNQVDSTQVARVTTIGTDVVRVQTEQLSSEQTQQMRTLLASEYEVDPGDITTSFVGPTWGKDMMTKAVQGIVIFVLLAAAMMAIYFRKWRMAIAAIAALLHDLLVTVGVYALIGFEVTPATVIGFLTILGYSLYDTVVVSDKVRENSVDLYGQTRYTYAEAANLAVNQTLIRSLNTSVVGLLPVGSILFVGAFLLGAGTLRDISLALFIGLLLSTLSSIFIATPLDVLLQQRTEAVREHTEKVYSHRRELLKIDDADSDTELVQTQFAGGLVAGQHLGQAAQPRKRRKK